MQGYFAPASLGRPPARDNVQNIVLVSGDNSTWLLARATCARRTGNEGESLSRALSNVIHIVTANFPDHDPLPFHDHQHRGAGFSKLRLESKGAFQRPKSSLPLSSSFVLSVVGQGCLALARSWRRCDAASHADRLFASATPIGCCILGPCDAARSWSPCSSPLSPAAASTAGPGGHPVQGVQGQ